MFQLLYNGLDYISNKYVTYVSITIFFSFYVAGESEKLLLNTTIFVVT
jgi:hypothetical protein